VTGSAGLNVKLRRGPPPLDKFNDESAFRSFVKSDQLGESGSGGAVRMDHLDAALLCGAANWIGLGSEGRAPHPARIADDVIE